MFISPRLSAVLAALAYASAGQATNFTIINGQIFTPGLAIVNAPQPNTPLGGGKPSMPLILIPSFPFSASCLVS